MDRSDKEAAVAELTEGLKGADAVFAVDYRGISVTDAAELRGKLREADAVFKVVKNRLAKIAAADAGTENIDDLLVGPTALTLIKGDAVIAAKAIADFAKDHDDVEYKGGFMDGAMLAPEDFAQIARLPGVDVLRGQLVGMAASPITSLVRGLGSMVSGLAIALGQIADQGLVTGEAPAPAEDDAPAEEPAATEEDTAAEDTPAEEPAATEEDTPAEPTPVTAEEPADAEPAEDDTPDAEPAEDDAPAEEPTADADSSNEEQATSNEPSEADDASDENDDNDAESSSEPEPDGEDSEDPDSETTTEEE